MPRQGDGSGDSGPHDGHEIVHGNTGDATLQHTQHAAPAPQLEKGDALPGMNAAGGASGPLNDASEEYGVTASKHERQEDNNNSTSHSASSNNHSSTSKSSGTTGSGTSSTARSGQTSSSSSSSNNKPSHKSSNTQGDKHDLDQVSREKAERYVNLNEEAGEHAAPQDKHDSEAQRPSQRAPRDVGSKQEVEQIHGQNTSGQEHDGGKDGKAGQQQQQQQQQGKSSAPAGHHDENHEGGGTFDQEARHKAEKFVNLKEDN